MKKADVVIIGGSAAGLTAGITSRRHYPEKSVLLVRQEEQVLIPCGIPYIFGTLGSCNKNLIPDSALTKNGIELLVDTVEGIQREAKTVTTSKGEVIGYDKLIIATGSSPVLPEIKGIDKKGIFVIKKDVDYLNDLHAALNNAKNVVIVGSGFIGVELAEECKMNRNIDVKILARRQHCLRTPYDEEYSIEAENYLKQNGVDILAEESVEEFLGDGKVEKVKLSSGKVIPADLVIIGIGCIANSKLAEDAGLEIGPTGGVAVNRYMQTRDENIFTCGDCAEKVSFYNGKPSKLKLASIATSEARIAGTNLFKLRRTNSGVIGVYSTMLNDHAFSGAGLTEYAAKAEGYKVIVGEAGSPNRHPGGMKGTVHLKVKLVFEEGSQILLGGQAVGAKSAGELINAISACIMHKMTADDIATFQAGTHPGLTASPIAYQLVNAAEMAILQANNS